MNVHIHIIKAHKHHQGTARKRRVAAAWGRPYLPHLGISTVEKLGVDRGERPDNLPCRNGRRLVDAGTASDAEGRATQIVTVGINLIHF